MFYFWYLYLYLCLCFIFDTYIYIYFYFIIIKPIFDIDDSTSIFERNESLALPTCW